MSTISRRSVAKGAAWSIPAVSVAAAAPSLAASPSITCADTVASFSSTFTGATWTKFAGTTSPDKTTWNDPGSTAISGTEWSIQLGNPSNIPAPKGDSSIGGVAFYGDKSRQAIVRTVGGQSGNATVASVGITTPVLRSTGLSTSISIQSSVPYKGVCPNAQETLQSISIPIVVTWYRGTTPVPYADNCSGLWLNYCYNVPKPGGLGCYSVGPVGITSSSVTTSPTGC